jgi:hypothetical protein
MKNTNNYLHFSREELANPKIREIVKSLVTAKLDMQKYHDFIQITPIEFEFIQQVFKGEFVPKERYDNITTFKNEVGKIRGKKLIVENEKDI